MLSAQVTESQATSRTNREVHRPCREAARSTDLQLSGLAVGRDLRGIATQTSFLVNDISGLSILEILTKDPCFS